MSGNIEIVKYSIIGIGLLAYILFLVGLVFRGNWKVVKRMGVFFWLIAGGFLYSMATKPPQPQITWGVGVSNNGTYFDTNTWKTIYFRWTKSPSIPSSNEIYFAAKVRDVPDVGWEEIGTALAGAGQYNYTFTGSENATNYLYYVFTGIAPVHTNGTWTARILKPAKNSGVDKLVILEGKILENGTEIAPFKE